MANFVDGLSLCTCHTVLLRQLNFYLYITHGTFTSIYTYIMYIFDVAA